ncbi:MAG: hypothetical protein JSR21_07125 [Proteobacteria bacterium]|nr:hypothetical protein [Pseudomonadota bacterium]
MRLLPALLLPLAALSVAACSRSSGSSSLTVSCNGQTTLVGATSITVQVDPASKAALLTFPDPVNDGQTGTIPVDRRCTITPGGKN